MKRTVNCVFAVLLLLGLCACGQSTSGQADSAGQASWEEQYELGLRYLEDGNYEEAIIAFTAAIEIDPKRVEAYNQLARVYLAMDDPDGAAAALEQGVAATGDEDLRTWLEELRETELSPSGPRTERQDSGNGSYDLIYFDEEGRPTRSEHYLSDGTIRDISYFDETGNGTRIEHYAPDGVMVGYAIACYDEAGNLVRVEGYTSEGTIRDISYYDEAGNPTRYEAYQGGKLWETTEY